MIDIMLDLESLALKGAPVIVQFSAIAFDMTTGKEHSRFSVLVDPRSCVDVGLGIDGETMVWWIQQDRKVFRKVVLEAFLKGITIQEAMKQLSDFIESQRKLGEIRVWGNGILSDNKWVQDVSEKLKIDSPIGFREHSDLRTLVTLGKCILGVDHKAETKFEGEKHNAIDDCLHQIKYCVKIFNQLNEFKAFYDKTMAQLRSKAS